MGCWLCLCVCMCMCVRHMMASEKRIPPQIKRRADAVAAAVVLHMTAGLQCESLQ